MAKSMLNLGVSRCFHIQLIPHTSTIPKYGSLAFSCQVTRKVGDKIWVLASPIHAPRGSQIERFAEILGPLEAMSHALFWTNEDSLGWSWDGGIGGSYLETSTF